MILYIFPLKKRRSTDTIDAMEDYLIQGLAFQNEVRFFASYTRDMTEDARRIHYTTPVCTAALGRLLTAGAMMGAMCKNAKDLITLKIDSDGPISSITVTATPEARVKGLINRTDVDVPLRADHHLDVGTAVGKGTLSVIKDIGLRDPYIGQTKLVSGEIAEDLTYYFAESEQVPTIVGLGVLVDTDRSVRHAGGFIIQLLPFASEETISELESRIKDFKSVTDYYSLGGTPETLMKMLLGDIQIERKMPVKYRCDCNRERVSRALVSLGEKELDRMIEENKPVSLHCDFCNKDYVFQPDEIKELREDA